MASFCAMALGTASAQQPIEKLLAEYKKPAQTTPNDEQTITTMREGKFLLTKPTPADHAVLKAKADYLVNRITWPEYHAALNEGAELKPRPSDKNMNKLITDLREWILTADKFPPDKYPKGPATWQLDYIREFGAAINQSILAILADKGPPPLLRISAMRMLVVAAETGAPAHWNTVHKMLTDPKTPPEILIYAVRAAEALFASYDPNRTSWIAANAAASEKIVVEMVQALEDIVIKGPPILDLVYIPSETDPTMVNDPKKPKGFGKLHPEQVDVLHMYRYHALRALGRINLEVVGGKFAEARPAYTLARVAIADPIIQPPPSVKEIGEALIGLANVVPGKQINADEQLYAMAWGLRMFAMPKTTNAEDATIAWKGYSARMQAALKTWGEGLQRSSLPPANVKKSVADFAKLADDALFNPVLKTGLVKPNALVLDNWLKANPSTSGQEFYSDKKGLKLKYPAG